MTEDRVAADARSSRSAAGVVRSGSGHELLGGAVGAELLAGSEETEGTASFIVRSLPPRALGSPVHTHRFEDEWTYVLAGTIGAELGPRWVTAGPGDLIRKPRGIPHAFWNAGDHPARVLEVMTPGGFEEYVAQLGRLFDGADEPDESKVAALAAYYGLAIDASSVPRLVREHGLRLHPGSSDERLDEA